jgi:hypothetical protein
MPRSADQDTEEVDGDVYPLLTAGIRDNFNVAQVILDLCSTEGITLEKLLNAIYNYSTNGQFRFNHPNDLLMACENPRTFTRNNLESAALRAKEGPWLTRVGMTLDSKKKTKKGPRHIVCEHSTKDTAYMLMVRSAISARIGNGIGSFWDETQIQPGVLRANEVAKQWDKADTVLVLMTGDLLAESDDWASRVMNARSEGKDVMVLIMRPCLWEGTSCIQGLEPLLGGKEVSKMDKDDAMVEMVRALLA